MPYRVEPNLRNVFRGYTALLLGWLVVACSSSETDSVQSAAGGDTADGSLTTPGSGGGSGAQARSRTATSSATSPSTGGTTRKGSSGTTTATSVQESGAGGSASDTEVGGGGTGTTDPGTGGSTNPSSTVGGSTSARSSGGRSGGASPPLGGASSSKAAGGNNAGGSASSSRSTAATASVSIGGASTNRTPTTRATAGGAGGTVATGATSSGTTGSCVGPKAGTKSKNPLFTDVYTADPSALVYDCTFYINCGHDEGTGNGFVMNNWFILKSTDLVSWTRIDRALTLSAFRWANANAWAGQMVTKGGKFYWFVPVNKIGSCPTHCGMAIGVAVGDSPEGPFTDYLGKPLIDDVLEMSNWGYSVDSDTPYTIDPTVFVDDDGQTYLQYGGFGRLSGVKLNLDGNNVSLNGKIVNVTGLTGFFEAPFLTKIRGTYYNVYARDSNPAKIDYATATNPMGPFTYRGRILDSLPTNSTDAATSHPAIAEFAGQWYLVYHVSNGPNGGGTYHRMVAVDQLTVGTDGTIAKITPTSGMTF